MLMSTANRRTQGNDTHWSDAMGSSETGTVVRRRVERRRATFLAALGLLASLSACSGASTTGLPAPVLPQSEIEQLAGEATAFVEQHTEAWPDVDAFVADYTEDYTYADPTWSDFRVGSGNVIAMLRQWESMTDYHIDVTAEYVSVDGAAFEETWPGLQPPMPLPPDPPVASGLNVRTFENGEVQSEDLWYRAEDNVAYGIGCFAVDDCPALQDTVDRYTTAWLGSDPEAIAALYSEDATFTDSMLGLTASGSSAIGALADERFGSADGLNIEVLDLYAWTDGTSPPSESNPEAGHLVGIAIHYRATLNGTTGTQEAITTLELGVKTENGIEADPEGLIQHEEVYHSPDSLLTDPQ